MFGLLGKQNKLSATLAKFAGASGINLPFSQRKQLLDKADNYTKNLGISPEDAVLSALTTYMQGIPWPEMKAEFAHGMQQYLETYSGQVNWSPMYAGAAAVSASEILNQTSAA